MAKYTIHNIRFYNFQPQAIHCMDYDEDSSRLALSRADGTIEVWDCNTRPFMQLVLPGDKDSSVEALVWCGGRLFSAGLHGFLLEHNLASREITLRTPVTGGPTWCLALSMDKKKLAAGTEGGYVCIFDVLNDSVMYDRALEKQEGRILHLAWHSSGDYIVTGSVNCVRLWSLKDGRVLRCGLGSATRKDEVIVWCVGILDDMTIVSGDSSGKVCFWNAELGTITHSLQTHKADVLTLAICADQNSLYVAGVDPTIAQVSCVNLGNNKEKIWVKGVTRSVHTHDVRALIVTANKHVYSGGVDTILTESFYPPKTVYKFPALPPRGFVSVAWEARSFLLHYSDRVELWQFGSSSQNAGGTGTFLSITEDRVKLLELQCKKEQVIQWCAVSPKAEWIAYLVLGEIRIFHFVPPKPGNKTRVDRIKQFNDTIERSHQVLWLGEARLASAAITGCIQVITVLDGEADLEREISLMPDTSILQMTSDIKGKTLVLLDHKNNVTIVNTHSGAHSTLPVGHSPITAIGIHPLTNEVVVAFADMTLREYNSSTNRLTRFSKEHLNTLCPDLIKKHTVIQHIGFDPEHPSFIFLHDDSSFIVVQKCKESLEETHEKSPKVKKLMAQERKQQKTPDKKKEGSVRYSVVTRPNQVLFFNHVKGGALVSVELNPLVVMDRLPPSMKIKKYGGN